MPINHIGILFFIFSQCFNLGLSTLEVKEYKYNFQNKPENIPHYTISKEKLTWKDASIACKKKGLSLAYVNSFREYINFTNVLYEIKKNQSEQFSDLWIGGHKDPNRPEYLWENGKYVEFYGWLMSHPRWESSSGDCLELKYFIRFGWDIADCQKLNKYMCVGEPHEEVMKTDYPDQYQRPNVETHEGGQNRNKLKVTTEALTTTSTSSPEYYVYGGDDTDVMTYPSWQPVRDDLMYDYDYNDYGENTIITV